MREEAHCQGAASLWPHPQRSNLSKTHGSALAINYLIDIESRYIIPLRVTNGSRELEKIQFVAQ